MKKLFTTAIALLMVMSANVMAQESQKVGIDRKVVGAELRDFKASTTYVGLSASFAKGSGVTAKSSSTGCYVDGVKMTAPNVFTPGKYQTLEEAQTNNVWFGIALTVDPGVTFNLSEAAIHIGSSTDGYIWDAYIYDEKDTVLYKTTAAYKISNCSKSSHSNDYIILSDSALQQVALSAGTYEVRIYLYGKKNNDILLKELSLKGTAVGGEPYVAPTVVMPDSLSYLVNSVSPLLEEKFYFQYKANLQEAIENAQNDTNYAANYAYLYGATETAVGSISEYAFLNVFIGVAKMQLADADSTHAGRTEFQNAITAAEDIYNNGSVASTDAQISNLKVAMKAFVAAGASEENPVDVTVFIDNADFSEGTDYWTITADSTKVTYNVAENENGYTGKYLKAESSKKFSGYAVEQTLTDLPNGDYRLTATVFQSEGTNYNKMTNIYLSANDKKVKVGNSSAAGGYVASVFVRVSDGTMAIKLTTSDNRGNVLGFGNIKLEYFNFRSWADIKEDSLSYVVNINSQESMDDAFRKTDWAEGKDVTFSFANGTYDLGVNVGRNFPKTGADFNIVAASGAKPVLSGSLRSNGMKLNNYKVEGITFHNYTGSTSTDLSPLHFAKGQKDSVMNEVIVRNCQFDSLPACLIRLNAGNDTEKYIHSIIVENNVVDGIAHHFFQFAGGKAFGLANFTFRENIVKNMYATGGQLFNTPVSTKHPANDSIYTMTVERNTFIKIGGSATAARNFLEFNKDNDWAEVYVNFKNNIFYDQYEWDYTKYSESNVAMFNKTEGQTVELNFFKNVVAPADAYTNFSLDEPLDMQPFPVTSGNIAANYDLIIADTIGFWNDSINEKLYYDCQYATAGTDGAYVGAKASYVINPKSSEDNPTDATFLIKNAHFYNGFDNWTISCDTANVKYSIAEGENGFAGKYIKAESVKKFANYTIEQTITGVPNGDYKFTAKGYRIEDGTKYDKGTIMLYANDKYATFGKSSADGGVNASVYVRVTDGTLKLKFFSKENRNNVIGFGEPKLEYYNFRSWASIVEDSTSYLVTINSQESMDDAFKKTDWAEGKDVTFSFANGTYDLGVNVGRNFPKTGADFNIVAASGAKPVLSGSLRSNGMKLNNFKVEGITFHNYTGSTSTDLSPLHFAKGQKDSVMNEVIVRSCQFDSLPACLIRLNAGNDTEKYIHSIIVENNVVDGIAHHFFQFAGGKAFGLANFTFRENIVKNMYATGGQLFNTPISTKHPANDSIYTMTVEHNAFYKIGGSATAARNFLECNKDNDWAEVYINFNNNIFYDQYEWDFNKYSESNVAMFNKAEGQTVELNFLKNVVAPADAYTNFALDEPWDAQPFPMVPVDTVVKITPNYDLIIRDTATWIYTPDMKMLKNDSLYTAGVGGTYVGPASNYYGFDMEGDAFVVENLAQFDEVFAYEPKPTDLTILFKDNTDECGYYALGMNARKFPQNFGDLTFKAYEGAEPEVSGSFRSSNGMKVNNYTVEGINFVKGNMTSTDASPLFFHKGIKDSVMNEVVIRNCTFTDMPACMIRLNASNDNKYIHSIIVENNVVDGIAHHFFQFASGQNFGLANFTFRENIVKNMYATGGQFFNAHLSKNHPANDSIYTMTVENNTFYKIGGCATAARKFLECSTDNDWTEVYININNNIFYDQYNWDITKYSESDVTLFTKGDNQTVEVNFLKNVVAPEGAYTNFSLDEPWDTQSFPLNPVGNILPEYDLIIADTANFWFDADKLLLWSNDSLYTAGIGGTYIGAQASYLTAPEVPANAKYFWASPEGTVYEQGGKTYGYNADGSESGRVNYKNGIYYTISLNGKRDWSAQYVLVELDEAIAAGDTIMIAAYRNKGDVAKTSSALMQFNGTDFNDGTDGTFYNDIAVSPEAGYTTLKLALPETAVGATSFKMARYHTSTNLFVVKLAILKGEKEPSALEDVKREVENNVIYNIFGQRVNDEDQLREGIYIINGKKVLVR